MFRSIINLSCIAVLVSALLAVFAPTAPALAAIAMLPWLIFKAVVLIGGTLAFAALLVCSLLGVALTDRPHRAAKVACLLIAIFALGGCAACLHPLARLIIA